MAPKESPSPAQPASTGSPSQTGSRVATRPMGIASSVWPAEPQPRTRSTFLYDPSTPIRFSTDDQYNANVEQEKVTKQGRKRERKLDSIERNPRKERGRGSRGKPIDISSESDDEFWDAVENIDMSNKGDMKSRTRSSVGKRLHGPIEPATSQLTPSRQSIVKQDVPKPQPKTLETKALESKTLETKMALETKAKVSKVIPPARRSSVKPDSPKLQPKMPEPKTPELPKARDCTSCTESIPIADLPSLPNCTHTAEVCRDCLALWIAAELSTNGWRGIKCPGTNCQVVLQHHDVQAYASTETFTKFDEFSVREALGDDPDFKWCPAPNCTSGQVHSGGNENNIFQCIECGYRLCTIHQVAWHAGETCDEYDYRSSGQMRKAELERENKACEQVIKQMAKRCPRPQCEIPINKNEGCDHMTCTKCRFQFCWLCMVDYQRVREEGNGAHERSCPHYRSHLDGT
jgi:hypothetical protein